MINTQGPVRFLETWSQLNRRRTESTHCIKESQLHELLPFVISSKVNTLGYNMTVAKRLLYFWSLVYNKRPYTVLYSACTQIHTRTIKQVKRRSVIHP